MNKPGQIPVWDWPVRIFHWLIVLHVPILWWTAENDLMEQHRAAGYVVLGLVLFRLIWGFVGSSTARFSGFVKGPRAILSYLKGKAPDALGHSPLGGWSVLAMLALLALQVTLGLFAIDVDGMEAGPLSTYVSFDAARAAADWHGDMFDILLVLIGLHIAAILFYAVARRTNLVRPMLSGRTAARPGVAPMRHVPAWRFFASAGAAAAAAAGIAYLA
ncbi:MAG: cytochrome b/b6 domain-containing protein [Allosphingosinicella sp.]|uniref:cytochrome b/b6 domain-containing protein n=1 Tax=Allosphingosinicella sp. TaxID=2823234 RepID=UPI003922E335